MAIRNEIVAGQAVLLLTMRSNIDSVLNKARAKLRAFQRWSGEIGRSLFRGGALASIPLGLSAIQFSKFEDAILFLETKIPDGVKHIKDLEDAILSLAKTTSFTPVQVAEAAVNLATAGFDPQEIKNSLQSVLDLARGARMELPAAATLMSNTIRTFEDIGSADADTVASMFVTGARKGTLTVTDMGESIKELGSSIKNLNIPLPQIIGLLTEMSFASLKGTKAGTSLNTALTQLAKKQAIIRDQLKVDLTEADGKTLRNVVDIFEDINNATKNMTESQIARLGITDLLFNIRGARGFTASIGNVDRLRQTIQEVAMAMDEAREAAKRMDSGLGGAFRRLKSVIETLAVAVGEAQAKGLIAIFEGLAEAIRRLETLVRDRPEIIQWIASVVAGITALGVALMGLSVGAGILANLLSAFSFFGGSAFGILGFMLNPAVIGVAIAASFLPLQAIFSAISERIRKFVGDIDFMVEAFKKGFELLKQGKYKEAFDVILEDAQLLVDTIGIHLYSAWTKILNILEPWIDGLMRAWEIVKGIASVLGAISTAFVKNMGVAGSGAVEMLTRGMKEGAASGGNIQTIMGMAAMAGGVKPIILSTVAMLVGIFESVVKGFNEIIIQIVLQFKLLGNALMSLIDMVLGVAIVFGKIQAVFIGGEKGQKLFGETLALARQRGGIRRQIDERSPAILERDLRKEMGANTSEMMLKVRHALASALQKAFEMAPFQAPEEAPASNRGERIWNDIHKEIAEREKTEKQKRVTDLAMKGILQGMKRQRKQVEEELKELAAPEIMKQQKLTLDSISTGMSGFTQSLQLQKLMFGREQENKELTLLEKIEGNTKQMAENQPGFL